MLINKHNRVYLKHCWDSKSSVKYTNGMNDIYENIEDRIYDMTADIISNKILNPRVTELFVTGRKLNIFFCFHYAVSFCST